jgi:hypothetical protein
MKRCLLALLGAGLVIACRNEPRSTTPAVFALPVAPIGHRVEVTEVPTPDELLAWQAAPTCPPPTVLVRHEGGSLGCYDEATALPHGPFVSRNERFVGSTGWYFDGKKDGTWTSYYSSEPQLVIEQGQWDHGVKVGLWRAWDMQREFTSSWLFDDEGTGLDQRWYDGHLSEQVPPAARLSAWQVAAVR